MKAKRGFIITSQAVRSKKRGSLFREEKIILKQIKLMELVIHYKKAMFYIRLFFVNKINPQFKIDFDTRYIS